MSMNATATKEQKMIRLSNATDEQLRAAATKNYENAPTHVLESVLRMNAGTRVVEKQITLEVARELLAGR